jgi:hypothetical protein
MTRRNPNVAAVVQANKTARIVWALLAHDREYDAMVWQHHEEPAYQGNG